MSKNNLKDGYRGSLRDIGDTASDGETYVAVDLVNPIDVNTDGLTDAELRAAPVITEPKQNSYTFDWSGTGFIGTAIETDRLEKLTVEITDAPNEASLVMVGSFNGSLSLTTIISLHGNTLDPVSVDVSEFDIVICASFSFGAGGSTASVNVVVNDTDTITEDSVVATGVEGGISYTAKARQSNLSPSHTGWKLTREYNSNGFDYIQEASNRYYANSINNRKTAFPPAIISNELSTNFDGVDEHVTIPNASTFDYMDGLNPLTVSGWIKPNGGGHILTKFSNTLFNGLLFTTTDTKITVNWVQSLFVTGLVATYTYPSDINGEWHHVAFTIDGSGDAVGMKLYFDGVELTPSVGLDNMTTGCANTADLGIADIPSIVGNKPFIGNIAHMSIWNVEFSDSDIVELYNNGKPTNLFFHSARLITSAILRGWWRLGDGDTFPTASDYILSNDGTMTNMDASDIKEDIP